MHRNKYLVLRRDGSIPEWPYFVIGAADPAAVATLLAYADRAETHSMASAYIREVRQLVEEFKEWRRNHPPGDPGQPTNRRGCQFVMELLEDRGSDARVNDETARAFVAIQRETTFGVDLSAGTTKQLHIASDLIELDDGSTMRPAVLGDVRTFDAELPALVPVVNCDNCTTIAVTNSHVQTLRCQGFGAHKGKHHWRDAMSGARLEWD